MEQQSEWLGQRQTYRELLFEQTTDQQPSLERDGAIPLSVYAFHQSNGRNKNTIIQQTAAIPGHVEAILQQQDIAARLGQEAVFCFVDDDARSYITDLTANVVSRWHAVCLKRNISSPFAALATAKSLEDVDTRGPRLVIETASAALEIIQWGCTSNKDASSASFNRLVSIILSRGPFFTERWLRGDVLEEYCEANALEAATYLDYLNPGLRRQMLRNHTRTPLDTALALVESAQKALSDTQLANTLGWSQKKIEAYVTPSVRKQIATNFRHDPLEGARRFAYHIDHVLTSENIAHILGKTVEEVDELFSEPYRGAIALAAAPINKLRQTMANIEALAPERLVAALGWPEEEVTALFDLSIVKRLSRGGANSMEHAIRFATAYRELLSTPSLMAATGWDKLQVETFFPHNTKVFIALSSQNPVTKVENIALTYQKLVTTTQLPAALLRMLAIEYPGKKARTIAQKVVAALPERPAGVSEATWAWTLVRSSDDEQEDRVEKARRAVSVLTGGKVSWEETPRRSLTAADIPVPAKGVRSPLQRIQELPVREQAAVYITRCTEWLFTEEMLKGGWNSLPAVLREFGLNTRAELMAHVQKEIMPKIHAQHKK